MSWGYQLRRRNRRTLQARSPVVREGHWRVLHVEQSIVAGS
jgi:hypothetical protein